MQPRIPQWHPMPWKLAHLHKKFAFQLLIKPTKADSRFLSSYKDIYSDIFLHISLGRMGVENGPTCVISTGSIFFTVLHSVGLSRDVILKCKYFTRHLDQYLMQIYFSIWEIKKLKIDSWCLHLKCLNQHSQWIANYFLKIHSINESHNFTTNPSSNDTQFRYLECFTDLSDSLAESYPECPNLKYPLLWCGRKLNEGNSFFLSRTHYFSFQLKGKLIRHVLFLSVYRILPSGWHPCYCEPLYPVMQQLDWNRYANHIDNPGSHIACNSIHGEPPVLSAIDLCCFTHVQVHLLFTHMSSNLWVMRSEREVNKVGVCNWNLR